MENFVLNTLVNTAKENDCEILKGEYLATAKNEMVKDHYLNLGFVENNGYWELNVNTYKERKCFISTKN